MLLILDLDETLIHCRSDPLCRPADAVTSSFYVYERPFLQPFLYAMNEAFTLAVWTSATSGYATDVLTAIWPKTVPRAFTWTRSRCTRRWDREINESYFAKKLKKVKRRGHALSKTLVVDDTPRAHEDNYGNLVTVRPYLGAQKDSELPLLMDYLPTLKSVGNVRRIEKRNWRSQTRAP